MENITGDGGYYGGKQTMLINKRYLLRCRGWGGKARKGRNGGKGRNGRIGWNGEIESGKTRTESMRENVSDILYKGLYKFPRKDEAVMCGR